MSNKTTYPTRQNFELDEIERLRDENEKLTTHLAAVRAEFLAQYEETPPVFQTRWARVKRLLE